MAVDSFENKAEKVSEKLICESCGKEFFCGANVGECWCFAIEVKTETLAELKENFNRCLCAACLEKSTAHYVGFTKGN